MLLCVFRFEDWMFPSDALMYGLTEIFPTFFMLTYISKTKLSCFSPSNSAANNSDSTHINPGIEPVFNPVGVGIAMKTRQLNAPNNALKSSAANNLTNKTSAKQHKSSAPTATSSLLSKSSFGLVNSNVSYESISPNIV